ncbi:unnamed protein product [Arabis nemorensis]|uniref:Isopenicillin N synthase-like Fe(2+) 2OG dioxygenase domain-containing protein n=1 Tax=Arabis nemorensis TaxID=586526 RepID=A0A565BUS3_9BRAS|nr:unnamed protein product [Arabis nemorensis]
MATAHGLEILIYHLRLSARITHLVLISAYPAALVLVELTLTMGNSCSAGLLTLVNQDDDKTALQVRNLSGHRISAIPISGSFVYNTILSNGVYESTLHRVINNSLQYRVQKAAGSNDWNLQSELLERNEVGPFLDILEKGTT